MRFILCLFSTIFIAVHISGCAGLVTQPPANYGKPKQPDPVSVVITDKFANQLAGGPSVPVDATVTNDSTNSGVTWTLTAGGVSCAPACGSLTPSASPSFSATYNPPTALPTAPNNSPTITAVSEADASKSDRFTFSLTFSQGALAGNYAYLLRGFSQNGVPMTIAGTVDLDTMGNIVNGRLDVNVGGQVTSSASPLAGTYLVDTSFNAITRGTLNITNFTLPGTNSTLAMKCALSADGKRGKVIEFDTSGFISAGTILQQNPGALTGAIPVGNFAFELDSDSSTGARIVEAGQFSLGAAGVTGGLADLSKAEAPAPIYSATPIAPGTATAPDASGRGTLALSIGGNSIQYAYYIVDSGMIDLIEIDTGAALGTVQAGVGQLQIPLTAGSVNSTSVFQMTGIDDAFGTQTPGPAVIIGVMSVAGASAVNLTFDGNDAGTVLTTRPVAGQLVNFDATTGRGVLSFPEGANNGFLNSVVFYLFDLGKGFLIDADPTTPPGTPPGMQVTNKAYAGTFLPKLQGPWGIKLLWGI